MTTTKVSIGVFLCGLLLTACHGIKDNPATCWENTECATGVCDLKVHECNPADGGADAAGGTGVVDANFDVVPIETRGDAQAEAAPECVTAAECKDLLRPICSAGGKCEGCKNDNSCTGLASGNKCVCCLYNVGHVRRSYADLHKRQPLRSLQCARRRRQRLQNTKCCRSNLCIDWG